MSDPNEAARHAPAWRALLARSASDEPMKSPLWLLAWWRVFGPRGGRKLRLVLFFDDGRLVGVAPLLSRLAWYRPALPFRRLEFVGSGELETDEICSEHLGIVAECGLESAVAEALAHALARDRLGAWDELVLPAMDADDALLSPFERALEALGVSVTTTPAGACPYVTLPASFDDYLARLRSEQRYLVRRSLRYFERWTGGDAVLHEARGRAELAEGTRVLEALHAERWHAAGRSGVFASSRFRAFHAEVMPALLDENGLGLAWLSVREKPIAAAYNVIWNRKVSFYQGGRSMDVPKGIRPGIVLHATMIRRAIEAGFREYDFLAGTSQYKRELSTNLRPLVRLRAVRSGARERLRAAGVRGVEHVKRLYAQIR